MPDIRLHLSEEQLSRVDQARGRVARVVWIRDAIDGRLGGADEVVRKVRAPEPPPSKPLPTVHKPGTEEPGDIIEAYERGRATTKEKPVKKAKGCQHPNTKMKFGKLFCLDCGEFA